VVPIQTAQGGTAMLTTHGCLKTCYVRDRTGELRPIITKTYIIKSLKRDLLSGKALNRAGYRIVDEDPEKQECVQSMTERSANPNLLYL
jgi:hypothetical protein